MGNKHIPDMSIYETSDFWDEHEFCEFDDVQQVHDLQFSLRKAYHANNFTVLWNFDSDVLS